MNQPSLSFCLPQGLQEGYTADSSAEFDFCTHAVDHQLKNTLELICKGEQGCLGELLEALRKDSILRSDYGVLLVAEQASMHPL